MRRLFTLLFAIIATTAMLAQTLNVVTSSGTTQFSAAQTGEMTWSNNGSTLTIAGQTFNVGDITKITVTEAAATTDETRSVNVVYNGTTASVSVSSDIADLITVSQSGAHVKIVQSSDVADEITYNLSGTSGDGEFYMEGSYKATIVLNGLTLTNTTPVNSGAAIHIQNGKRINIKLTEGTTSTIADAASGSQKGCLYVKGQAEFKQKGTLNVAGNLKHAIKSGEYISVKNATINVTKAVGDGISCNEYFLMESGTVNISGTGDDGIQCDLDGDTSTGETTDHEDEDSGNIYISEGTITINCTATAAKGIKSAGDMRISGGTINITTTGDGEWDSDEQETKAAACLSADGAMTISGGTLTLTSTGSGGKGAKADGNITISDGTITVKTTGGLYYNNGSTENKNYTGDTERISNSYYSSPKGIKSGVSGDTSTKLTISGGTISVSTAGNNGEGIESKGTLDITGGQTTVNSYDDAINAASHLTVSGGYVYAHASNNDGMDSNGNMYIKGGLVYAVSSGGAEVALDANTEGGYKLYIQGGTVVALGGLERGAQLSQSCYQASSWSSNTWYSLTYGSETFAFKTPSKGGNGMVVSTASTPSLASGVSVSSGTSIFDGMGNVGGTISGGSSVTLNSYSGNSQGGGPGGNFPGRH